MKSNRMDDLKIMTAIDRMNGVAAGSTSDDCCKIIGSGHLGRFGAAFVRTFIPNKRVKDASVWLSVYAIEIDADGEYHLDTQITGEEIRTEEDKDRFGFVAVPDALERYYKTLFDTYTRSIQDGYPCDIYEY